MPNDEQKPEKVGWGKILLGSLAYLAVGLGFVLFMLTIAAVLLVGFLTYACGHH